MKKHIGTSENKVEAQLNEINNKCSEIQKTESQVRKYLKKLSSNSKQKSEANLCSHMATYGTKSGGKENFVGEDDFSNVDYNRIIKTAMKNYPNDSVAVQVGSTFKHTVSSNYDEQNIIDVDAVCRFDEGKQILT